MLMSKLFGERLRDKPNDASLISHIYLLRGGYIRPVGSGIYSMMTPALRIQQKIEKIIREEMNAIDGQEVLLPVVLPGELWKKSGRFDSVGSELLRTKDRCDRDIVLAMTHEEAAVQLAKTEAKSYVNYPFMIYQIQTKFRDEPRARGGLIRVREFTMKDAYSFHLNKEDLEKYYLKVLDSYNKIYERVGVPEVISIKSDSGMMGGSVAHEFMLLCDAGEDSIVLCENCDYKANMEVATSVLDKNKLEEEPLAEILTEDIRTIDDLAQFFKVKKSQIIKAVVYKKNDSENPVIVFIRGDLQVNESKLKNILKEEICELNNIDEYGLIPGFVGPNKQINDNYEVIYDISLEDESNMICGANKENYHFKGFNIKRDLDNISFCDVSKVEPGQKCSVCGEDLTVKRGVEVGNIFQLGNKYTKSMEMTCIGDDGKAVTPIMGCYGIGVGRLIACIIEAHHDDFGPIWPKNVAPWQVHVCALNTNSDDVKNTAENLYRELSSKYEVLFDDRNLAAGVQFADADLLGVPVRIIVSKRNVSEGKFEVVLRDGKKSEKMDFEQLIKFLNGFYN